MRRIAPLSMNLAAMLVAVLAVSSTPARALNQVSWIASGGNDASDCSRTTPCATLGGALPKTTAGGEITCADSGNLMGGTIAKSITVNCEGHVAKNGTSAVVGAVIHLDINIAADDRVVLRGLDISESTGIPVNPINFIGAGTLVLDRMNIGNVRSNGFSGISFTPNGPAKLIVTDSIITNGGGTSSGAGILIKPQAGGTAQVALERIRVSASTFGIAADGSSSSGGINMTIADSLAAGNLNDGIIAVTTDGGAPIGVYLKNTRSANNGFGIRSIGPNVPVRVDASSIIGNSTGLSALSGGQLLSYGNNAVQANGANGAFSGSVGLQ